MRECGECTECCISAAVEELNKPMGVPCKNICDIGCSIYKDRPGACRFFSCQWLKGDFADDDKPCKTKMVVWLALTDRGNYALWGSYRDGPPDENMFAILMENSRLLPVVIAGEGKKLLYQNGRVIRDLTDEISDISGRKDG
jgi:hypothetical protein